MTTPFIPRPRRISRRGWVLTGVVIAIIAVAYAFVLRNYDTEGGLQVGGGADASSASGILVTIEPLTLDTLKGQLAVQYTFMAQGADLTDEKDHLKSNVRIFIQTLDGVQEVKYIAGDSVGRVEGVVGVDGEIAAYPFDSYGGTVIISSDTYGKGTDGSLMSTGVLPVGLQGTGGINGWDTGLQLEPGMVDGAFGSFELNRAFSTQVFALLILAMVTLLAVIALWVSLLVMTNRRRVEAALLGWTASLLFALPLLRTYLPNSPPVGAAIDVYLYLWVIVAAVAASVIVVLAWVKQTRRVLRDELAARGFAEPAARGVAEPSATASKVTASKATTNETTEMGGACDAS